MRGVLLIEEKFDDSLHGIGRGSFAGVHPRTEKHDHLIL